eukprot:TRINITY_DN54528_c0_g1_i1.p1 TRINITY_DN54528_c0_g1~~TRINITY_DN54528_c0_g1_i1.p1  ORF type:complete len:1057 (+),score=162.46 TRINITY_DN54528_c0_g1_i1:29-3172(+)
MPTSGGNPLINGAESVVAFAATFSIEPLERWLRFWFGELGLSVQLSFAPYGQLQRELHSPLLFATARACVGLANFADWQRDRQNEPFDCARFEADFDLFLQGIHGALAVVPSLLVLLCPSRPSPFAGPGRSVAFSKAVGQLKQISEKQARLSVLTAADLGAWYPVREQHDVVADEIGHLPYTEAMWCALGAACARMLLPALAPPLKVVVVDCDFTLWHNAVGEVGPSGIVCAPRHRELQERLLALQRAGVLLCLCSRNFEKDVWQALDSGETLLRREHFSGARIDPHLRKSVAISELADEMQVAFESMLFIDDNPAECGEVRSALPEVPAWCMPQVHAEVKKQLLHVWRLDVHATTTSEDALRAESFQAQTKRQHLRSQCASVADFHRELRVRISFQELADVSDATRERVLQLQQRTNQFNAWKRWPLPLAVLSRCEGLVMTVSDRYGEYGIVGMALCRRDVNASCLRVVSWTMSCRVLGRGVEHALMAALGDLALRRAPSCSSVCVGVVDTERNQPVRRFLTAVASILPGSKMQIASSSQSVRENDTVAYETADIQDAVLHAWEATSPSYWWCFSSEALKSFTFDPCTDTIDATVSVQTEVSEDGVMANGPVSTGQSVQESQRQALQQVAAALTDIPVNLRTVDQAMRRRGCELEPSSNHDGCSSAALALQTLRRVWRHVLELPPPTEEEMELQDDVPFAASGGDSVRAVRMISLAERFGVRIPRALNVEMMTIRRLLQTCSFGDNTPVSTADTSRIIDASKKVPRQACQIFERDSRDPKSQLRISGISACADGNLEEAKRLVGCGGWQPAHAIDRHGNTALMWAAGCGELDVVRWLLEVVGVSVDSVNKDGRSALMWAGKNAHLPVVRYLLEEGGASAMLRMKDDSTAFDWAVLGGSIPTMEYLASHPDIDLHALNKFGCSAVQWAAASGNVTTCRWLYTKGIDFSHVNQARHGAVNKAAWKGHEETLRWLLLDSEGPRLTDQLLLLDHEGLTVAQLARTGGQSQIADWLQELSESEGYRHGAGPSQNDIGQEALAREKARCAAR